MNDTNGDISPATLARLGVEIWRLGARLHHGNLERARDSHERLLRAFEDLGGRIEDRAGEFFVDGMTAEILDQPQGIDPAAGTLVWAETIRPGIVIGGQQVLAPQVLLAAHEPEPSGEPDAAPETPSIPEQEPQDDVPAAHD